MEAIETIYRGFKFRSRTEARWAVFFDALNFRWLYEHEGFTFSDGTKYLPDFFFPVHNMFAEVKGSEFTKEEIRKCSLLSKDGSLVVLLDGPPDEKSYRSFQGGHEWNPLIFMPRGHKFYPFYDNDTFSADYCDGTMTAINKSRSARFEFGEGGWTK